MKSSQLIADALSSWRTFQDAADLAHENFHLLDPEEIERLAHRAFTEEFRGTLRRKDANGVPLYGNVELIDPNTGEKTRRYKQTALFDADDYQQAIRSCNARISSEARTRKALIEDAERRLGVQLTFDGNRASA